MKNLKNSHGGARPRSGVPKGYRHQKTLTKEAAKEALRTLVIRELHAMTEAQFAAAKGIQHFVLRQKDGKFKKVESAEAAVAALNDPEAVWDFWARDPSTQAYAYLIDQALDRAAQPQQVDMRVTGQLEVVTSRLESARARVAKKGKS